MKNLKTFENFNEMYSESEKQEIIDYITQIFTPVSDDYFYCNVSPSYDYYTKKYGFTIEVGNRDKKISREYLEEYLEHLRSYMNSKGYKEKLVDKTSIEESYRFNFEFYPVK
jgi:hypothetical protein